MKVSFELDGLTIKAVGTVTNSGYVTVNGLSVKNKDDEDVVVDRQTYEIIEELAEEQLYDKKFTPEL